MSVSQERRQYSLNVGNDAEKRFVASCEKVGYKCEKSDEGVDIYEHIDFWVDRIENKTSVDVKGGNHPKVIWVEFNNVNGENGWIYGSAEYIAFDMPELEGFVMVTRTELLRHCDKVVEKVFVSKEEATRKLYQRKGRKDVISRLELFDLQGLNSYKILKY